MTLDVTGTLVVQEQTREWCRLPYPGHPRGCPNWGQKSSCPPKVCRVEYLFNLSKQHWFVVVDFDLAEHVRKMKLKHPDWSDSQLRCVLYWQGKVRSQLKKATLEFVRQHPGTIYSACPEAMGVNVFRTCHRHGLMMKKNPQNTVYKVTLVGYPR